ncbi:dTMP kinase, partial [Phenoliferia sp. Uapishka_3]
MTSRGAFIVLEGLDRSGKSTQVKKLVEYLNSNGTKAIACRFPVVCDRYAFSGIAFSAVKGLSYSWCLSPDIGLPSPDLVLFLSLSPAAAAARGGFGNERYETSEVQRKVRDMFQRIAKDVGESWENVDASGSEEEVAKEVRERAERGVSRVKGKEVGKLWSERIEN